MIDDEVLSASEWKNKDDRQRNVVVIFQDKTYCYAEA